MKRRICNVIGTAFVVTILLALTALVGCAPFSDQSGGRYYNGPNMSGPPASTIGSGN